MTESINLLMEQLILQKILEGRNVFIVGSTDSGKSYFIKNKVIPLLEHNNIKVSYFKDCESLKLDKQCDVYIVDEVEILFDKIFLENKYPKESPYFTKNYLEKVKKWHKKLSRINKPVICVVTRNTEDEIDYLSKNYKSLEWNNLPVDVIRFQNYKTNN